MNDRIIGILEDSFTQLIIPGITATIPLTLISFAFGLAIALFLAIVRTKNVPVLATFARLYVWIFRGTPLLVQLFVIFYGLPSIGITLEAFPSAIIAFSLNVGAYASEAIRGAIAAVPKGQFDAGASMGMNYLQIMRFIHRPPAGDPDRLSAAFQRIHLAREEHVARFLHHGFRNVHERAADRRAHL